MKKIFNIAVFIITLGLCSSCNNTDNAFPVREELLSMSLPEQVNLLQSSPADVVYQYYKLKLDNTLESKKLTNAEKNIIRPLKDKLSIECYSDAESQDSYELRVLMESISQNLVDNYGWDEKKLFMYFETIMTEEEFEMYLKRHDIDW